MPVGLVMVQRDGSLGTTRIDAGIVQPEDVVGVGVCDQDIAEVIDVMPQGLLSKIRRRVDEEASGALFNQEGGAQTLILGICRGTDRAAATDLRHAMGGPCS